MARPLLPRERHQRLQLPALGQVCERQQAAQGRCLRLRAYQERREEEGDGGPCRQEGWWKVCAAGLGPMYRPCFFCIKVSCIVQMRPASEVCMHQNTEQLVLVVP
jgi:hypothetical protein